MPTEALRRITLDAGAIDEDGDYLHISPQRRFDLLANEIVRVIEASR